MEPRTGSCIFTSCENSTCTTVQFVKPHSALCTRVKRSTDLYSLCVCVCACACSQEELRHRKIAFFIVAGLVVFAFLMYTRGNESSKVQQSKRRQQKEERYQKLMSV